MIAHFQLFAEPYVMTQGGPLGSTRTVVLLMYEEGFRWWRMGLATAIAFLLFAIMLIGIIASSGYDYPTYVMDPAGERLSVASQNGAAAVATIRVMKEEGLIANANRMGQVLVAGLRKLQEEHPEIGDVRGAASVGST